MYVFLIFLIIITIIIVAFIVSPVPLSKVVKKIFEGGMAEKPEDYDKYLKKTFQYRDIPYNSKSENGYLDIILKKNSNEKLPVIFWVHGGGFVGGDKSDLVEYGTLIASQGFAVVNINYGLAPEYKYPSPLIQLAEAYKFININSDKYNIDIKRVFFAGDSAGASIAAQFVNTQVDEDYRKLIGIEKVISRDNIMGAILVCGPYDIKSFKDIENKTLKFMIKRIGWAYLGNKNWFDMEEYSELSLVDYISDKFPSSFISDGNFLTFEDQGKELRDILREKKIRVVDVFGVKSTELVHNYQFMMDMEESKYLFKKLIEFLNSCI